MQHNKQAELIALSNAESLQRQELSENFHTIKENWHRLMNRQRWLDYWQNIYSRSLREGANKRGNSSRLTQSFHFFMFEPIFSPVNALNQPI